MLCTKSHPNYQIMNSYPYKAIIVGSLTFWMTLLVMILKYFLFKYVYKFLNTHNNYLNKNDKRL